MSKERKEPLTAGEAYEFAFDVASYLSGVALGSVLQWRLERRTEPADSKHFAAIRVLREDGPYLYLSFDSWRNVGRVSVSGGWPSYTKNDGQSTERTTPTNRDISEADYSSITVAVSRGPEAVAKEIARRLLPNYLKLYAVLKERAELHQASGRTAIIAAQALEREFCAKGGTPRSHGSSDGTSASVYVPDVGYLEVNCYDGKKVSVNLPRITGLGVETARKVLQALKEEKDGKEGA